MSIPKHLIDLLRKLEDRTKAKKINWLPTSRSTEFQWNFAAGMVSMDSWRDPQNGKKYIEFVIYNSNGEQTEKALYTDESSEYQELLSYYVIFKKSMLKADETYESLINELDNI